MGDRTVRDRIEQIRSEVEQIGDSKTPVPLLRHDQNLSVSK